MRRRWVRRFSRCAKLEVPNQLVESANDAVDCRVAAIELASPSVAQLTRLRRMSRGELADFRETCVDMKSIDDLLRDRNCMLPASAFDQVSQLWRAILDHADRDVVASALVNQLGRCASDHLVGGLRLASRRIASSRARQHSRCAVTPYRRTPFDRRPRRGAADDECVVHRSAHRDAPRPRYGRSMISGTEVSSDGDPDLDPMPLT